MHMQAGRHRKGEYSGNHTIQRIAPLEQLYVRGGDEAPESLQALSGGFAPDKDCPYRVYQQGADSGRRSKCPRHTNGCVPGRCSMARATTSRCKRPARKGLSAVSGSYQSAIDRNFLEKGEDYENLPESYIIFVCDFDYYDLGFASYERESLD